MLDTQKKVAAEKARVHATAIAGRPVPYVDAQGFLMKEVSAGVKRRRDSEAAQVVRDEVSASRPAKIRKLYAGPGASLVTSTRFETVDHFKAADAVVVDNLAARTCDDAVLCASLWGKALCDNEWFKSGGERGTCFQYVKCGGKDRRPLHIHLSEAFQKSRPVVSDHLLHAAAHHDKHNSPGPDGKIKKPSFRVLGGKAPDRGQPGVKCLYVVPAAELKKEAAQKRRGVVPVSLEGLALELGAGAARL